VTPAIVVLEQIEAVLTEALIWFHETVGLSWAWSIVAVTVAVRMLLVPIAVRQIHSMQSLQIHAPEMKAIQQRYKHDRQKQSEELMKFYKENKINPYASCLPIVFQIPIFIGLFFVLRDFEEDVFCSEELGGQDKCTGGEDPAALPEYASELEWLNLVNITADTIDGWGPLLLVIYVASQLTSTWLMSTSMQSAAQRWMIMLLPIVFIPFILEFPSGLMIYWLTTNLWSTGQGLVTRRLMPRPVTPPKRTSRTPPREVTAAVDGGADAGDGSTTTPAPTRSGPPRRVKRKKGGGGRRR
jgi:YidC/Oxa1 family membrane protein insertase